LNDDAAAAQRIVDAVQTAGGSATLRRDLGTR
jgi:hypothetical protein